MAEVSEWATMASPVSGLVTVIPTPAFTDVISPEPPPAPPATQENPPEPSASKNSPALQFAAIPLKCVSSNDSFAIFALRA